MGKMIKKDTETRIWEIILYLLIVFVVASTVYIVIDLEKPAHAAEFTASYEHLQRPHSGNNYDDGRSYLLGIRHPIYKDLKGRIDAVHITDIDFPTDVDVKGSFGELRGYGAIYNLIFDLPYNKNVSFNLSAGAGPVWWQWRPNPYMQDNEIKTTVDPAFVYKVAGGVDVKIYDNWQLSLGIGWQDCNIGKKVVNRNGDEMNLLDAGDEIGLQYVIYKIGIIKRF